MFLTRLAAVGLLLSLLAVSLDGEPAPERKISKRGFVDSLKEATSNFVGSVKNMASNVVSAGKAAYATFKEHLKGKPDASSSEKNSSAD